VATVDREGRTIFVADAHRGDGQRFVVHADEKLTAFLELESAIRVAVNSRKATAINYLTTDRRAFAGFPRLRHMRLHPPGHNTW
jgi:hypothetical protein